MSDTPTQIKNIYERRVRALFVQKGMFINRLDRPWMDTPFWLQGFLLRSDKELSAIRQYCDSVYIDISRGIEAEYYMDENLRLRPNVFADSQIKHKSRLIRYRNLNSLKSELAEAQQILETSTNKFNLVMDNIQDGKKLGLKLIPSLIQPMVDSIIRNADALPLLTRLRNKQNLTYFHAIDSCVLALSFGRFLGLPLIELNHLATGCLLLDIGKVNISNDILNKTEQLTDEEYAQVCTHVEHGVNFLKQSDTISEDSTNIVLAHHERNDGSGYPNGIRQAQIPAYARMAGIIDCYNAMSSTRPFRPALTPHHALQQIYNLRDKYFQFELVEKFLNCLGTYPNGSLIELNTGEVGVVLAQNHSNRLKPQILPLLDATKKPYREFNIIDLTDQLPTKQGKPLSIVHDLTTDTYNIDLSMIYDKLKIVVPEQELEKPHRLVTLTEKVYFFITDFWAQLQAKLAKH